MIPGTRKSQNCHKFQILSINAISCHHSLHLLFTLVHSRRRSSSQKMTKLTRHGHPVRLNPTVKIWKAVEPKRRNAEASSSRPTVSSLPCVSLS